MGRIALLLLSVLAFTPVLAANDTGDVQNRIFSYFLNRANEGDMSSQFIIGSRYENGTGVERNLEKAYQWYAKAAAQGHPLAQQKMEDRTTSDTKVEKTKDEDAQQQVKETRVKEQTAQAAKAREQALREQAAKTARELVLREHAAKAVREQAVAKEQAAKAAQPVVKANPEPVATVKAAPHESPDIVINAMDIVLKGSWKRNQTPAEYLPSTKTSCLQAGDGEVVCFSQELQRTVGNSSLMYTAKAILSNFAKNGEFTINYVYNVVDIDTAKNPAPSQDRDGIADIAVKLGWQEPGRNLDCKAINDKAITCVKDKKYTLQFVR